ncbi:MAG: hypothetical protein ACREX4_19330 [Gammaproteobacteria bacterium]
MVLSLDFARSRLLAFLDEAERLIEAEFPYSYSEEALNRIRQLFERKLKLLEQLDEQSDPATVQQECALTLRDLFNYVPLVGFILRSTNVRNAFEVFGPLLRLARNVLESQVARDQRKTRLVLSSEWDYSPFIYPIIPALPGFVMIGLPAPESANPLLFPLAGHELGHSVWAKLDLSDSLKFKVTEEVISVIKQRWTDYQEVFPYLQIEKGDLDRDMFAYESWEQAVPWALGQAEESFCDFVGLRIFGRSFLDAFAYLLSPTTGSRSPIYPSMHKRVVNLIKAANYYDVIFASDYEQMFTDDTLIGFTRGDEFRIAVADEVLDRLVPDLISTASTNIRDSGIEFPSEDEIARICERFKRVVPAERCKSLADILNAGWRAKYDVNLWEDLPEVKVDKDGILKELVLKNIEVFEIEQILKESP